MSKSKKRASKSTRRKDDDDLTPKEWQARHNAAYAIVARKYCDMFKFWRDCRYKPCRSARRCAGDARDCLNQRCSSVPYNAGIAARERMSADTPPNADRFVRDAYHQPPHAAGKCNPKLQERRAKNEAKRVALREAERTAGNKSVNQTRTQAGT